MFHTLVLGAVLFYTGSLAAFADTVHYVYDSAGRLVKADNGARGAIVYTYDNAGNLTSRQVQASGAPASVRNTGRAAAASRERRPSRPIFTRRRQSDTSRP